MVISSESPFFHLVFGCNACIFTMTTADSFRNGVVWAGPVGAWVIPRAWLRQYIVWDPRVAEFGSLAVVLAGKGMLVSIWSLWCMVLHSIALVHMISLVSAVVGFSNLESRWAAQNLK